MARCTKEEALETRDRILDAGEQIFYAKGVANTSLADVAEAAGVTRGAIYWHFRNKSDLFNAMCERVRLPLETMVESSDSDEKGDPLGQLRDSFVFVLKEAAHNPHYRKVFAILFHKCEFVDPSDPIVLRRQEWFGKGMQTIERILRNAMAKGQLPPDLDPALARTALLAHIDGLLSDWLFMPESFDLPGNAARLIDASIEMLRCAHSLRRTPGAGSR